MEESRHVFFASNGAEAFADEVGVERVANNWFSTEKRLESLREAQAREMKRRDLRGTVGCVARDQAGNLAAATSTGGMTNKRYGRIGDSPVIGAGTWAENGACAVSCTGTGEEFIRHNVARSIAAAMRFGGWSLDRAARHLIDNVLQPDDGGLIAVSARGEIAMPFSSPGMFRGAANGKGLFQVSIWD
jgi:beta-aspartyl-peptidase (threonine type)